MIFDKLPDVHSKWFIRNGRGGRKDWGGASPCVTGKIEIEPGSTLNNCVGLAWGLTAMLEDNPDCKIGFVKGGSQPANSQNWWNNGQPGGLDDYERGLEPREGAIICYYGLDDHFGHVAFVNEVLGDKITCLSSGYGNSNPDGIDVRVVRKSEGYKWPTVDYLVFQGFIYPKSEKDPKPLEPIVSDAVKALAAEVMEGKYGNQPFRKDNIFRAVQGYVNYLCKLRRWNERQNKSL